MLHQQVFNTSQICFQLGIRHAVLSPGSRNAPLTLSFARHPEVEKWIIPDERAAAFIALGIAQELKEPVALCCTSGTALLNYAPAIAEAYYRQIPLIVLSADRPPELIDQRDGQTIRQFEALKNHVKCSIQLPVVTDDIEAAEYQQQLITAVAEAGMLPKGPVHLNIPFREPFYPEEGQSLTFTEIPLSLPTDKQVSATFRIPPAKKVLVVVGQDEPSEAVQQLAATLSSKVPILRSPLNNLEHGIAHVDGFIQNQRELSPDVLITSGLSVLSKKLKTFIRKNKPQIHLHFDESGVKVDTYQTAPDHVKMPVEAALEALQTHPVDASYLDLWMHAGQLTHRSIEHFMQDCPFSEAKSTFTLLGLLPTQSLVHLSNSMPVRYVDLLNSRNDIVWRSNRGTSGIDGCTSTAIGNALVSNRDNYLLTGDLAFLYDRNAFFHNYPVPNLKIIIMNNQGGGIFRLIDGPARQPELEDYFETRHNRTAEYICKENDLTYFPVRSEDDLHAHWKEFSGTSENISVMEIFTEPDVNQRVYQNLRKHINEQVNSLEKSS